MDESTPHLHAVVVPLTADGRLCAKQVIGDKIKMKQMQTEYAKIMEHFGLNRGKEGSRAIHEDVKEYYKRINNELPEIRKIAANLEKEVPDLKEEADRLKKEIGDFSRLKGFKMGAEALVSKLTKKDQVKALKEENSRLSSENLEVKKKIRGLQLENNDLNSNIDSYKEKIQYFDLRKNGEILQARTKGIDYIVDCINNFLVGRGFPKLDIFLPHSLTPKIKFENDNDNRNNTKDLKRGR
jgi:chromosome segregation ATPase